MLLAKRIIATLKQGLLEGRITKIQYETRVKEILDKIRQV